MTGAASVAAALRRFFGSRGSIRRRLMLSNSTVVMLVFIGLAVVIRLTVDSFLMHNVDVGLLRRLPPPGPPPEGAPGPELPPGLPGGSGPNGFRGTRGWRSNAVPRGFGGPRPDFLRSSGGPAGAGRLAPGNPPHFAGVIPFPGGPPGASEGPVPFLSSGRSLARFGPTQPWDASAIRKAQHSFEPLFTTVTVDGELFRVVTQQMAGGMPKGSVLQAAHPLDDIEQSEYQLTLALFAVAPFALIAAALAGSFATSRVLRRVGELSIAASRIGEQDVSQRLPAETPDEFGDLARSFNGILDRLEAAFSLQSAILERQKQFTADASHELRTPLTLIRGNASLALSSKRTASEYQESLRSIEGASTKMAVLIQNLLDLARLDTGSLAVSQETVSVSHVIEAAVAQFDACAGARISIEPTDASILGVASELERVIVNLLVNARRYTPHGGEIKVEARRIKDCVFLAVTDSGPGVSAEDLPHLGERFFRSDKSRAGTEGGVGLGLAISRAIVRSHAGVMRFENVRSHGLRVTIELPLAL